MGNEVACTMAPASRSGEGGDQGGGEEEGGKVLELYGLEGGTRGGGGGGGGVEGGLHYGSCIQGGWRWAKGGMGDGGREGGGGCCHRCC